MEEKKIWKDMDSPFNVALSRMDHKVLALAVTGDLPVAYHAVIKRENPRVVQPYVVCSYYDIKDGTWGNGTYFDTFTAAMEYFGGKLG